MIDEHDQFGGCCKEFVGVAAGVDSVVKTVRTNQFTGSGSSGK